MSHDFLTARWKNVILLTYRVPAELLTPRLPPGCVLDVRPGDSAGHGYVSLVAFDFLETRVLGVGWPGYRNFPEINLRFYVRHGGDRGVCFIREFVPKRLVATMARRIYNEPYRTAKMASETTDAAELQIRHRLWRGGEENVLAVTAGKTLAQPAADSVEHFFKEHQWGFGITRGGKRVTYEVSHPVWDVYPVRSFHMEWNWARVYGDEWGLLQGAEPVHVMLAAGSAVRVSPKRV